MCRSLFSGLTYIVDLLLYTFHFIQVKKTDNCPLYWIIFLALRGLVIFFLINTLRHTGPQNRFSGFCYHPLESNYWRLELQRIHIQAWRIAHNCGPRAWSTKRPLDDQTQISTFNAYTVNAYRVNANKQFNNQWW